jgi:hypothetical protein
MSARAEIENTLYRYAWGFDSGQLDLLESCFVADAELASSLGGISGRAAIREFFEGRRQLRREAGEQSRHVTTNVLIEQETADSAVVRSYFTVTAVKAAADGVEVQISGWYLDEFVVDEDQWRIRRRTMEVDGT